MRKFIVQVVLCLFFLQYSLIAESRGQSLEKSKQSHSHSSRVHKTLKKQANSLIRVGRSGNCHNLKNCKNGAVKSTRQIIRKISEKKPVLVLKHGGDKVLASWYGPGFEGNETKCHTTFNSGALTAASNTLKCGTKVRLFNASGNSVVVVINDTGSFTRKYGRDLDVSYAAAKKLGFVKDGKDHLELIVVSLPSKKSRA